MQDLMTASLERRAHQYLKYELAIGSSCRRSALRISVMDDSLMV